MSRGRTEEMRRRCISGGNWTLFAGVISLVVVAAAAVAASPTRTEAAAATGCEGGGFVLAGLADGSTVGASPVGGDLTTTVAASRLGPTFLVQGRYVEFTVVSASFGVQNWTLT